MAKIFLVDDYKGVRETLGDLLELLGHEVVSEAGTLEEAIGKIPQLQELGVAIAILDGSLTRGGNEGEALAKGLRSKVPHIKIVSHSTQKKTWGDINLEKPATLKQWSQAIENLLRSNGPQS